MISESAGAQVESRDAAGSGGSFARCACATSQSVPLRPADPDLISESVATFAELTAVTPPTPAVSEVPATAGSERTNTPCVSSATERSISGSSPTPPDPGPTKSSRSHAIGLTGSAGHLSLSTLTSR
jgi:hypothetical protein